MGTGVQSSKQYNLSLFQNLVELQVLQSIQVTFTGLTLNCSYSILSLHDLISLC